ncbi:MAG: DinB family protein [Bacteroidota bacterium]
MSLTHNIAKHFREIHFGGNWTCSNLKDQLADVTWQEATTKIFDLNTILTLTYHTHYYVDTVLKVLQGGPLVSKDELSFNHPPVNSQEDWEALLAKVWADAEQFATMVEQLPDEKMWEIFTDEKYGIYYRNLHGIIEHTHYHLGQIAIIKKIIRQQQ